MDFYTWIKSASRGQIRDCIYWIYRSGVLDGEMLSWDDESGYFGGAILDKSAKEVITNFIKI